MTTNHRPYDYPFRFFDKRMTISSADEERLSPVPMQAMTSEGCEIQYKIDEGGVIYLFDVKELKPC